MAPLLFLYSFLSVQGLAIGLQCRDEADKPVDWFVAVKLPHLKESENLLVKKGEGYVFISSHPDVGNFSWILSNESVRSSSSIMGRTLKPLYDGQTSQFARILYNDEPPHGNTTMMLGHTKGVAVADNESGFWLVHSVPHYPPEVNSKVYSYPDTGLLYGQSFLCITVRPKVLETIGKQLMFNEPDIYDAYVPEALRTALPSFTMAAEGKRIHSAPWYNAASFSSSGKENFTSFAKSKKFGKDLYADWVAPYLRTSLWVETWNHGPGARIRSACDKSFKVENVEAMSFDKIAFKTGADHSKWAVSSDKNQPWVCVGDINRMEHQKQRGGGTVCTQNSNLFQAYWGSVAYLDSCPARIVK